MTTALTGRQPSAAHTQLIHEVLSLYQLHPTDQSYAHYHPTATFHDPVSIAQGLESIKAQFNGMPKLFARSETRKCEVLEPAAAGRHAAREAQGVGECVVLSLTQHYVLKGAGTSEKTLESKVSLAVDGEGLVRYHEEEWDHQPNKTGEDGFMGKLQEWRKKADAKMVEAGVSSDPKKV